MFVTCIAAGCRKISRSPTIYGTCGLGFLAAPMVSAPEPWRPAGRQVIAVSGLLGAGFATDPGRRPH